MKNISQSKIIKHLFAALMVALFVTSYFVIKNQIKVKGDDTQKYPVIIADGYKTFRHETGSTEPLAILEEAGTVIYPEDKVRADLITNPSLDSGVGQKITIERAPRFYILVDNKELVVRNWNQKAGSILKKSGVILGPRDIVSVSSESAVLPGESIVITRINVVEFIEREPLRHDTVFTSDNSLSFGQKKVLTLGSDGVREKKISITYKNGVEVKRELVSSRVAKEKVNQKIARGRVLGYANFGRGALYEGMVTAFYKRGYSGRYLLVTNLDNGKQVKVRIIGWGPTDGGLMDMGTSPFMAISNSGTLKEGVIKNVSVQLLD